MIPRIQRITTAAWRTEEVTKRWVKLYPTGKSETDQLTIQSILASDELALLAAMTYVDLNPIRANIAPGLNRSKHTSVRQRYRETLRTQEMASLPLLALTGANSFNLETAVGRTRVFFFLASMLITRNDESTSL